MATDRESLKAALVSAYPNDKPGAVPVNAGQPFRFVNELAIGDVVIYRSAARGRIFLGEVIGPRMERGIQRRLSESDLADLILSNYEQLDAGYERIIPLKRMYVPQKPVGNE